MDLDCLCYCTWEIGWKLDDALLEVWKEEAATAFSRRGRKAEEARVGNTQRTEHIFFITISKLHSHTVNRYCTYNALYVCTYSIYCSLKYVRCRPRSMMMLLAGAAAVGIRLGECTLR